MPGTRRRIVAIIVTAIAAAACSPNAPTPSASPSASASSPSTSPAPSSSAAPASAPASVAPASAPPATSQVLVRASARELSSNPVTMSPAIDGTLFVGVPSKDSTVVTRLDPEGRTMAGWPITLDGMGLCDRVMAVSDGSIRMVCRLESASGQLESGRAFAFGADGRALPGWPVEVDGAYVTGGLLGDTLHMLVTVPHVPQSGEGDAAAEQLLLSIDRVGTVARGASDAVPTEGFELHSLAPDGAVYAVLPGASSVEMKGASVITAITDEGRGRGISVDGVASAAAFDPGGSVVLLSAFPRDGTSRVIRLKSHTLEAAGRSGALPFAAADPETGDTGGCTSTVPEAPETGEGGTTVLYSDVDEEVFALDASLKPAAGWPFALPDPLVHPRPGPESEHEAGYCPGPLAPAVGPDGTVYLALDAHTSSVGGSLVAVAPNGRVRSGWPVQLTRAGAEFWSLAVGPDGTVYTIAYEPAAGGASTATLLSIAPDSTILYRTTIVAP